MFAHPPHHRAELTKFYCNANQFEQWFPRSSSELTTIIRDNCSSNLQTYQNNTDGTQTQELCRSVLNCVLANSDQTSIAIYQAANVLLGLTPTALSILGNSVTEISLLSSERPLLALSLAVGSPVIAPSGTFKYQDPLANLKPEKDRKEYPRLSRAGHVAVSVAQYLIAAAAATNTALLTYDLSSKAIFVPICSRTYSPFMWMYSAALVHLISICAFSRRVTIKRDSTSQRRNCITRWLHDEVTPCALHCSVRYEAKRETYLGLGLAWVGHIATVAQFVYGTTVLSSTTLINTADALIIIIRFATLTILCRIVLMFELYGLQAAVLKSGSGQVTHMTDDAAAPGAGHELREIGNKGREEKQRLVAHHTL